MLLKDFISGAVSALEALYARNEARAVVSRLCSDVLGTESYTHIVEPAREIDPRRLPELEEMLARLKSGEPVQYVTGHAEFCGFDFRVTPDVLIPRQETELLCRHAGEFASRLSRMRSSSGKFARPVRIIDLCTGSGCIAWSLALTVPMAEVTGVDISEKALEVARTQPFSNLVKERGVRPPQFVLRDVLETAALDGVAGDSVDLITSNPPYVTESEKRLMSGNVLDYEPHLALFVPDDDPLLYYRAVAEWSARLLSEEGVGFTEINEAFGEQTAALFRGAGFRNVGAVKDFCGKNRFVRFTK